MSEGPLAGVKVIELTLWMLGPLAGAMLGDLGADVVKIENPRRPDSGRNLLSNAGFDMTLEDGRSLMFEAMNRNKRGMALDLSTEAGKAVLLELVRDVDVVLENFRPGALDRLGVGYERLKEINPKLIYASASGHGFAGPDAGRPALDPVGQARSGLMWTHGGPQDGPNWHSLALADSMGANMLAYGVVAALAARDRTGVGEKVEVSHMMGSIWLSYWAVAASMLQGIEEWPRFDRRDAANPLFNQYRCGDGEWIFIACVNIERDFPSVCRALDLPGLLDDPRFAIAEGRFAERRALIVELQERFEEEPRSVWLQRLSAEPDLIFDPVQHIRDLPNDPAVIANGYLTEYEHPTLGRKLLPSHPVAFRNHPTKIERPAPELGEHTSEVLKERLGYDDERIAQMMIDGVIA